MHAASFDFGHGPAHPRTGARHGTATEHGGGDTLLPVCAFALLFASMLCACGGDNSGDDEDVVNCEVETRDDTFVVGLAKTGQQMTFTLTSATPAPPMRGDNAWTLQLTNAAGPLTGATIVVSPFMPDHGHGTSIEAKIIELPDAGQYELSPINMWMPALWETTIQATANGVTDRVIFRFCVPG